MSPDESIGFPAGWSDERELLLSWLNYLRGSVLRKLAGISDEQARWRPEGASIAETTTGGIRSQSHPGHHCARTPKPDTTT